MLLLKSFFLYSLFSPKHILGKYCIVFQLVYIVDLYHPFHITNVTTPNVFSSNQCGDCKCMIQNICSALLAIFSKVCAYLIEFVTLLDLLL